jgi:hypothetical protein
MKAEARGAVTAIEDTDRSPRTPVTLLCQSCGGDIGPNAVSIRDSGGGSLAFGMQAGREVHWIVYHHCVACASEDERWLVPHARPCTACGRPVIAPRYRCSVRGGRVFCSKGCEGFMYRYERHAAAVTTCLRCGDAFTPGRGDSKYCSGACRQAAYRQRKQNPERDSIVRTVQTWRELAMETR